MRYKVGIVGAGIFGCTIARVLAQRGNEVVLFEKEDGVLRGGTKGSIFRLHSGAHYPRHLPTAIQSRLGMKTFLETYRDAINTDFMNIYATMKTGSRVSTQEYQEFLNEARIPHVALSTLEMKAIRNF
jgi:L-2-hydroxyglutarate oxidase LhgO